MHILLYTKLYHNLLTNHNLKDVEKPTCSCIPIRTDNPILRYTSVKFLFTWGSLSLALTWTIRRPVSWFCVIDAAYTAFSNFGVLSLRTTSILTVALSLVLCGLPRSFETILNYREKTKDTKNYPKAKNKYRFSNDGSAILVGRKKNIRIKTNKGLYVDQTFKFCFG